MNLADLPTPCLVLDRVILQRNIARMAQAVGRHGVGLRPHMKTAKSIDVARLALQGQTGGITVSTLAEAEYFAAHGIADILYAVGITPQKLDQVAKLNAAGAHVTVITDDPETAATIAAHPLPPRTLIEIDTGESRGGVTPDDGDLLEIAAVLGPRLGGVMTHAGHSYSGRSIGDMARIAEAERAGVVRAAETLRGAGHVAPIVSMGSSPTALHAEGLAGVTEVRAGVYMFGDLFQAEIGTNGLDEIAVTVVTSVIGRRPGRLLVDAGGLALSKDRSTEAAPRDYGYGLVLDLAGQPLGNAPGDIRAGIPEDIRGGIPGGIPGGIIVRRAYQEHGLIELAPGELSELRVGDKLRIAPNHTCMTAAAHDRYHVIDGGDVVVAVWPRINGW
jgi:D-serine deaminase-like pyridoxal phosphate-dependent protein